MGEWDCSKNKEKTTEEEKKEKLLHCTTLRLPMYVCERARARVYVRKWLSEFLIRYKSVIILNSFAFALPARNPFSDFTVNQTQVYRITDYSHYRC